MPLLKIPTAMRSYVNGVVELRVNGNTVIQAVQDMLERFPALKPHLTNNRGELRSFVNLFLGDENIKDLPQGLNTPLAESDTVLILPSVAGG
jgi:molybdopterin converting factor small subunit